MNTWTEPDPDRRVSSVAATLTELQMELEDLVARAQQRVAAA